jgi:hypothetical protein
VAAVLACARIGESIGVGVGQADVDADDASRISAKGVASLERQVLETPLAGVVLRYGRLYGPGAVQVLP